MAERFDPASLPEPIVLAPLGGGPSTPALAAAVSEAGGLGTLAGAYLTPDALADQLAALQAGTRSEEVFFGDVTDGLQASEVGACAEPAPGSGHDDRAYAGVVLGVAQQREVAVLEVVGPGVQLVRPVERQHQDRSAPLGEDQVCVLGGHACSSSELW